MPRVVKASGQWLRALAAGGRPDTRVVFVVGSQRSGTRLPLEVLEHAPQVSTFSEGSQPYFDNVLLKPLDRVERLLRRSPAAVVALKPICETHRTVELLDRFPASRAIWIFRHYQDAVNSASVKWRSGRDNVRRLATGELHAAGWRAGGLSADKLDLVRRLYRDDMSLHEANAVMWFLRNDLYFDLHADERPDVLLVRYEDLVRDPSLQFARVFDFVEIPPPSGLASAIRSTAGTRRSFPEISSEVRALCERLHERLLAHYTASTKPRGLAGTARAS